jgi:hypothetical protein
VAALSLTFASYAAEEFSSAALFLYAKMDLIEIKWIAATEFLDALKISFLLDYGKMLKENR